MTKPQAVVEYRALKDLKELPGNPRTIKKDQFEKLKESIKANQDYFEARPIILSDRTGELVILAGNQRYKAAKALGMTEVPTILLPNLTEEREREIIIRDNVENGDWTGGTNVDTGATNRKLGSDMGRAVTGGGLHGKDLSKADVAVNIVCYRMAQETGLTVEALCAIGDASVEFKREDGQTAFIPYADVVEMAREYIKATGGFEKFAEWGLI